MLGKRVPGLSDTIGLGSQSECMNSSTKVGLFFRFLVIVLRLILGEMGATGYSS